MYLKEIISIKCCTFVPDHVIVKSCMPGCPLLLYIKDTYVKFKDNSGNLFWGLMILARSLTNTTLVFVVFFKEENVF